MNQLLLVSVPVQPQTILLHLVIKQRQLIFIQLRLVINLVLLKIMHLLLVIGLKQRQDGQLLWVIFPVQLEQVELHLVI